MSTMIAPAPPSPVPVGETTELGWRDIDRVLPDGTRESHRVPLTLEDCLHPQEGDVILESYLHDVIVTYLSTLFRARLADHPDALVLSDTGVYWDLPELRHHSPDISVIFGVREPRDNWPSFVVADEGTRPSLIIEVVSPATRENDIVAKVRHYHRARVKHYVIVDRVDDAWQLVGYQYTPTRYLPMPKDESGRIWLETVGVWLGLKDKGVACYDGETNREFGDYTANMRKLDFISDELEAERKALIAERSRADEEAASRAAAEARVRELEERLARLLSPDSK